MADGEKLKPLVGELLPPFPRVMVQANPFTPAATREHFGVGTTIAEMVASTHAAATQGQHTPQSMSSQASHPAATGPLRDAVDACQRQAISAALAAHQGNWAQAARALDVDASNLHKLARRLGVKG